MTGLKHYMIERDMTIKELSYLIKKSPYQTGQKLKHNSFKLHEIIIIINFFGKKFEELFINK